MCQNYPLYEGTPRAPTELQSTLVNRHLWRVNLSQNTNNYHALPSLTAVAVTYFKFLWIILSDFLILSAKFFVFLEESFPKFCCKDKILFFLLKLSVDIQVFRVNRRLHATTFHLVNIILQRVLRFHPVPMHHHNNTLGHLHCITNGKSRTSMFVAGVIVYTWI